MSITNGVVEVGKPRGQRVGAQHGLGATERRDRRLTGVRDDPDQVGLRDSAGPRIQHPVPLNVREADERDPVPPSALDHQPHRQVRPDRPEFTLPVQQNARPGVAHDDRFTIALPVLRQLLAELAETVGLLTKPLGVDIVLRGNPRRRRRTTRRLQRSTCGLDQIIDGDLHTPSYPRCPDAAVSRPLWSAA